jgi:flagellar hook-associated protein 1 FlgK
VLGVNTYFTGRDSSDIGVRQELQDSPGLLNAGATVDGNPTDNGTALSIATLRDRANSTLGGVSIAGAWHGAVQSVGLRTGQAAARADATSVVRQSLDAQRAAVSGVSVDEESVNLLTYQRQYQGAAKFIAAVDQMTQILIQLV